MCSNENLIKVINAYIEKADDDLADNLAAEGYAKAKKTKKHITQIEDAVAEALKDETDSILSAAEGAIDLEAFAKEIWPEIQFSNNLAVKVEDIFKEQLDKFMPEIIEAYIKQTDKQLILEQVSSRTTAWIGEWSKELGEIMKLNSNTEIENILQSGLKDGLSIQEFTSNILESGIRDEYYKARRVAITEVLRAHSVAREEGLQQSPAVEQKEWVHTGNYRNQPRQNHVDMNGAIVDKDHPFTLIGADGVTYYPQYPRDSELPPGESISCHCIHRGIVSEEVLGLPLEERQRLQAEAVAEMDDEWEKELDAKNKAKAGIE